MARDRITLEEVAPDLREAVRRLPRLPTQFSIVRRFVRWAAKRLPAYSVPDVAIRTVTDRGTVLRIYEPAVRKTNGGLFWIHGGGFLIGTPAQNDQLCAETAQTLGMVVVSTGYRLAPENPFPAALDDCRASWHRLQALAGELGIDPARVVVGGESAGGGLAATLVQRLCDEAGVQPFAQWLFYPMLDDRTAARRELDRLGHPVWNNRANRKGWRSYLGAPPGGELPAYASASRRADLAGLPPAWIGVGSIDLFAGEDRDYAARLAAAGVSATLIEVPGAAHGFVTWAPDAKISRDFMAQAMGWLAGILADPRNG